MMLYNMFVMDMIKSRSQIETRTNFLPH